MTPGHERLMITEEDLNRVVAEVRRLAVQYPDAVYESPDGNYHYDKGTAGGAEGCLIGQAARNVCRPLYNLFLCASFKGDAPDQVLSTNIQQGVGVQQIGWLTEAQEAQDTSNTWSTAVEWADDAYPLS